jgi:hypothetical protein
MNDYRVRTNRRKLDLDLPCHTQIPPAVPDDEYDVKFVGAEESHQWKSDKLYLWFQMVTPGEWQGKEFFMACNWRKDGKWGPSHKFMRVWSLANGGPPKRHGRMNTSVFCDKVFRARMRTVTKDADKHARTPAQQYSLVDDLLGVVRGAADVSCKLLIVREDIPPQVGVGMGKSASEGESASDSKGVDDDDEYEDYDKDEWWHRPDWVKKKVKVTHE